MQRRHLMRAGFLFGLFFPLIGTLVEAARLGLLSWSGLWQVQAQTPLLWIIDSAPFVLGISGRLISREYKPSEKTERQLLPLLMIGLLVPVGLLLFALNADTRATRIVTEVNRSGALRYQSLYIYSRIQRRDSPQSWRPVLAQMQQVLNDLRLTHPQAVAQTDEAWQSFHGQIQKKGAVDWTTADTMRQAANQLTSSLQITAERNTRQLLVVVTLGLLSLLVGFVKSYDLLRQLRLARAEQDESEQRFAKLAEGSFEGIVLSKDGVVLTVNQQFCSMYGCDGTEEMIGVQGDLLVHPDQRALVRQKMLQSQEKPYETVGLRKDGSTFPMEVEGKMVLFHGEMARVTAIRDLSERKRMEDQLKAANERLEKLAATDELTGLPNRRAFNQQLKSEWERVQRYETSLSLVLLDIDKFKNLNDNWGHDHGDVVLKAVSRILQSQVRPVDLVARYGGEEMVIVLPNTDEAGSIQCAERCRLAIAESEWPHIPVTASFGAATFNATFQNPEALIKAADKALYTSKDGGRNRTTHFSSLKSNRV